MAIDSKYGRVTLEHGNIAEDEQVVVFRAQDRMLAPMLRIYRELCMVAGSPDKHLDKIREAEYAVTEWQKEHFTRVPQSK